MENKFNVFWQVLQKECPYELTDDLIPYMMEGLKRAGFDEKNVIDTTKKRKENDSKPKKISSYNIFLKETMSKLKEDGVEYGNKMKEVSIRWRALSDEEKLEYKSLATGLDLDTLKSQHSVSKVNKKMSGYQLFIKENMSTIKNDSTIAPKERLSKIANLWKNLSDEEKDGWKQKSLE